MPSGSGGGGTTQTIQQSDPWYGQQAPLRSLYDQAQNLPYKSPYPFPGYVPYSPETAEGIEALGSRARAGNPLLASAQSQIGATTAGDYLGRTPGVGYLTPSATGPIDYGAYPGAGTMAGTSGGQRLNVGGYAGAPQIGATAAGGYLDPLTGYRGAPTLYGGARGDYLDVMNQYAGAGALGQSAGGGYLGAAPGTTPLAETARGDYLYGSPGFDAAFEAARRQITPAIQGQFGMAGRSGSGLEEAEQTRALGDAFAGLYSAERERQMGAAGELNRAFGAERQLMDQAARGLSGLSAGERTLQQQAAQGLAGLSAGERGFQEQAAARLSDIYGRERGYQEGAARDLAGIYGGERGLQEQARLAASGLEQGAYEAERNRMMQSAFGAPGMAAADYGDIQQLMAAGGIQEAKAGEALADAMRRFEFEQQAPYDRLGLMSQIVQGGYPGGTQTTQAPNQQTSMLAGALGGGALGYGAAQLPFFSAGTGGAAAGAGAAFAPWLPLVGAGLGAMFM